MKPGARRLLNPQSIAIVGASQRSDAIGSRVLHNLRLMGYTGALYPVNPRYESIDGLRCWPSLSSLPPAVDAAFLAVPASGGPALAEEAGRCGIKALFVNANGYADGGPDGIALQNELMAITERYGMALSGPNNMGLVNVHDRIAVWSQGHMRPVAPGPVAVIAHSGTIALILIEDQRDLGFAYLVTTGNEAGATAADYLACMAEDDRVQVILLFLETIRDPQLFARAATEAARRGKRVIALKVGASAGGSALVQAHTGSLAGEDRLYEAFFRSLGVIRVRDLDEMLETAVLFSANTALPPTRNVAAVTLSGGEAALISDIGHELGLDFMPLGAGTLAQLRPAFPDYATIGNPVDAWGLGFDPERFQLVVDTLLGDPALGTVMFSINASSRRGEDIPYGRAVANACLRAKPHDKRIVFASNSVGNGVSPVLRGLLAPAGIPYLSGMRAGLAAVRNMARLCDMEVKTAVTPASAPQWPADEPARFRQLSDAGIPMAPTEVVDTRDAAATVAVRMGFPVALKGIADHLPHKSDLGLVRLRIADAHGAAEAFDALAAILAHHARDGARGCVVVQKMADEGIELIVGVRNDPGFGSFIIVGPGGVLVDVANQASVRRGPVDEREARAMLAETPAARLLAGVRGNGPWDADAAAHAIGALSRFGAAHRATLATLEINPLIVGRIGVQGVDVLAEPHLARREP